MKSKRNILVIGIICLSLISLFGYNRMFRHKVEILAKVYDTGRYHWGRGFYKQIVRYSYVFDGKEYKKEFIAGKLKGTFRKNSKIVVSIDTLRPQKCKFVGRSTSYGNYYKSHRLEN